MPPRLDKAKSDHRRRDRAINVHLGPDIKAQWTAYCKQLGKTPGAALKEAIELRFHTHVPLCHSIGDGWLMSTRDALKYPNPHGERGVTLCR